MSRLDRQLQIAAEILQSYTHQEPFHLFLQAHFRANKHMGSKDRRFYRQACYAYFRFGYGIDPVPSAISQCISQSQALPENNTSPYSPTLGVFDALADWISPALQVGILNADFQHQPKVYLVVLPQHKAAVTHAMRQLSIPGLWQGELTLCLPNGCDVSHWVQQGWCWVMDKGSQALLTNTNPWTGRVWDVCAGAGGKSLLIHQMFPQAELHCSDIRPQILENLKARFGLVGFKRPAMAVLDLTKPQHRLPFTSQSAPYFDRILADVPCSGSGTWRRTPENRHGFNPSILDAVCETQRNIVKNALPWLKPGGILTYATCSIFAKENEDNIQQLVSECPIECMESGYVGGPDQHADTLYRATLVRKV